MNKKPVKEKFVIDGKQAAKVALEMYQLWEKQMEPPIFTFTPFNVWLEKLIKS